MRRCWGAGRGNVRGGRRRCHGQAAPTHLSPPKALAEGIDALTLQLLEERTHLGATRSRLSAASPPKPPAPHAAPIPCPRGGRGAACR